MSTAVPVNRATAIVGPVQRAIDAIGGPDIAYRVVAVLVLCIALSLASSSFLSQGNLLNVLRQASLLFLIASGLTLVLIAGGIDLSVGANLGLSACLAGLTIQATGSVGLAFAVGIGAGIAAGFLNGCLVTFMRVPPFIATYGMLWVLTGLTYLVLGGDAISGFPQAFRFIGSGYLFGIPVPVYLMLGFLALGGLFAQKTTFGQQTYAIGANPEAALLSGVPVRARLILVYTVSGAMAGLAALVFLARINSAEGDIGETLTLPAITAVLIGGTSLFGGVGTLTGTLIGALTILGPAFPGAAEPSRPQEKVEAARVAKKVEKARSPRHEAREDAEAVARFQKAVKSYAELHDRLISRLSREEPVTASQLALALMTERSKAQPSDILIPEVHGLFKRMIAEQLGGPDGLSARRAVEEGNPAEEREIEVVVRVNAPYPAGAAHSTVPPSLLLALPVLPSYLHYRFVGRDLILVDTVAQLIIDFLPAAAPASAPRKLP